MSPGKDFDIVIDNKAEQILKNDVTKGIEKKQAVPVLTKTEKMKQKKKEVSLICFYFLFRRKAMLVLNGMDYVLLN